MKVVLSYSGGLDTSIILKMLQEKLNAEVVTVTVDVGQRDDFQEIEEKAYGLGAVKHYTVDARKEFAENYVFPAIKANALYDGEYPLATALARPLIARKLVEIAELEGGDAIAHGCTGKGNDQVRFDISIKTLNPDIKIIAPVRECNLSRDWEMEYAKRHGIPVSEKIYSIDENLWGRSIEGGALENPWEEPPEEIYEWTKIQNEGEEYIDIGFEKGVPVALNGEKKAPVEIIEDLNIIAGAYGIGRIDHIENRVVGIKSREIYEAPAAEVILKAHKDLEKLVLTKWILEFKDLVDSKWAWVVYSGLWFEPLRYALDAFIDLVEEKVSGVVKIKLSLNHATVVGRESPYALYNLNLATYEGTSAFEQDLATGFIEIFGMQSVLASRHKIRPEGLKEKIIESRAV